MKIKFAKKFQKRFQKTSPAIQRQFEKRMDLFMKNPHHALLQDHPLKGYLVGCRSFSITGDYRVIYRWVDSETIKLIDIGTHSQLYK